MLKNIIDLNQKFIDIKMKGWIKSIIDGNSSVGRTFETLLGNNENNLEIPDYNGIEIKTKTSKKNIFTTLFNCKPEGLYYKETERIKDTYGYPDRNFPKYKVLNNSVFCNEKTKIGNRFYFELKINKKDKKIFLHIYDTKNNLLEKDVYWDFQTLEEKLYRKLEYLAYIHAIKKYSKDGIYFKYTKIKFYKLKTFNEFINLLDQGKIRVTFKVSVYKKGKKKGKTYDHGTGFDIKEEDLLQLYDEIII
ncbi:MAG: MvaI/BcnI restriction endonuclease family protein [Lactobacillales bacterium]|nr:MvaI/BcnI restriction endonuclease family protein [Lactobacillales bacterium]